LLSLLPLLLGLSLSLLLVLLLLAWSPLLLLAPLVSLLLT
jgi:hypothetical protein